MSEKTQVISRTKIDCSRFCATCGRERKPLEQQRQSWRFDDTPICPQRESGPAPMPGYGTAGWQITNDLIVSCCIYRNGGTSHDCHLCDDCLRIGLRAIKAEVDATLEATGGNDNTAEVVKLTEELGRALHRCWVLESNIEKMQARQS